MQFFRLPVPVLRKNSRFFVKNAPLPSPGLMKKHFRRKKVAPKKVLRNFREFSAKNAPFPSPGLMKIDKSLKCVSPRTRILVKVLFPLPGVGEKLFFAETDLHENAFCPLPGQGESQFDANPGKSRIFKGVF